MESRRPASESEPRRADREAILRGVYEDNLRTSRESRGRRREKRRPLLRRNARFRLREAGPLLLAFLIVAASAAGLALREDPSRSDDSVAREDPLAKALSAASSPLPVEEGPPTVAELYGLQLRTIVIDPGHGGRDPGAVGQDGLQEKDVTLDVAYRLKRRLERHSGYHVLLTRQRDGTLLLRERIAFANEQETDLFVSLHVNWIPVDSIAPIETYFYGPGSDRRAVRLAQRENRNSGFTVAEFNDLTRQLGLELKIQESRDLATHIQTGLIRRMRDMDRDVTDWGAKSGDFMVLLGVHAPSVLVEIGSISNRTDETRLRTATYRENLASFLEQGILTYLTQQNSLEETD